MKKTIRKIGSIIGNLYIWLSGILCIFASNKTDNKQTQIITIYATQNQTHSGNLVFHFSHLVVPGFHRDAARMAGMDGKNSIPAGTPRFECGSGGVSNLAYAGMREGLLLRHLPFGRISGHCRLVGEKAEEESLFLFAGKIRIALWLPCPVSCCPRGRHRVGGSIARALQFLRAHCKQPLCAALAMGQ